MFEMKIQIHATPRWIADQLDDDQDFVLVVHDAICGALTESGSASFLTKGFGQERWPVDLVHDFSILLPDIVSVLRSIANNSRCELNFPEQGIQRVIDLKPQADSILLHCRSGTTWSPNPDKIDMPQAMFLNMLRRVLTDYKSAAEQVVPNLASNRLFVEWAREWRDL